VVETHRKIRMYVQFLSLMDVVIDLDNSILYS